MSKRFARLVGLAKGFADDPDIGVDDDSGNTVFRVWQSADRIHLIVDIREDV